ncbi:MarR family transcriptional regulator [Aureimonas fodinaquatilis]|uniref:MarR family transcriptional regulator n=1 Tax=Aureimonas fodinaquatilis TaxID=2565783 RepID=A0A5B0E2D4_9HYPH|nr:MarR family transcriptional regulator [Aureimonas fodinaquatilis]KAA0972121.1 MarR family transcriptional regulator [Aureimonas fodinaquatilis]
MKREKKAILSQLTLTARAERTLMAQRLSGIGLHAGQDAVLLALAEQDGMALAQLAEWLSVTPPTITKTITRLSAENFVEKRPSPTDGRQSFAFLTDAGLEAVSEVRRLRKEVENQALAGFSPRQRSKLAKLLKKVERNLAPSPANKLSEE